ncbi:MAG: hypothetical protein AB8U27_02710 [Rickettsia conorii subsp. raoultii]|uniref:hypothetical protein n=1 Tax=Rickettsia conorii TaxID=781 RepID=UPI003AF1562C
MYFILREIFNIPKNKKECRELYILGEFLFKLNLIPLAAFEYLKAASIASPQEEKNYC